MSVDFPEPFGPIMATFSPWRISKSMESNMVIPSLITETFLSSSALAFIKMSKVISYKKMLELSGERPPMFRI